MHAVTPQEASESFAVPRWRIDLGRVVATGAGGGIALAVIGTHHGAALTSQAEANRTQANAIQRQLEWRLQVAQREAAIESVGFKVYADAFREVGGFTRIPGADRAGLVRNRSRRELPQP